jgi:pseudouridine kinase
MAVSGKVVVVGGANLDIRAVSAEALVAETSNPGRVTLVPGGVARNIAENLARLGVETSLISVVGTDLAGDQIVAETKASGVDVSGVTRREGQTGIYCAILEADGNLSVAVNAMSIMESLTPDQVSAHKHRLAVADYIIADCNLPAETLRWIVDYAANERKRLIIDPVSVPKSERLRFALDGRPLHGLTPNRAQARTLTGKSCESPEAARKVALALHDLGVRLVALHLDREGVLISEMASPGMNIMELIPSGLGHAAPRDVTGGGDAAIAGFVFALLRGRSSVVAARIGQIAAATLLSSGRLDAQKVRSAAEAKS